MKDNYEVFVRMVNALDNYEKEENKDSVQNLFNTILLNNIPMPLPSGNFGNSLAVALEMERYKGALLILKNNEKLNVDTNCISFSIKNEESNNFIDSLITSFSNYCKNNKETKQEYVQAVLDMKEYYELKNNIFNK